MNQSGPFFVSLFTRGLLCKLPVDWGIDLLETKQSRKLHLSHFNLTTTHWLGNHLTNIVLTLGIHKHLPQILELNFKVGF